MNIWDVLILGIVAAAVVLAVRRTRKKGGSCPGCCGGCACRDCEKRDA